MGRSSDGTAWSVPRMSQVLTSVLSFQSAVRTSSTRQSTRTAACSSAADITWAWMPPMSPTTRTRSFLAARLVRWWRASRNAWTCSQLSSAATGGCDRGIRPLVEQRAATGDELVAPRAGADQLNRRANQLTDPLHVVATLLRQVVPAARGADVLLPPGHLLVGRLAVLVMRDVRQRVIEMFAAKVVAGADLQQRLVVEDVQPHERGASDPIQTH